MTIPTDVLNVIVSSAAALFTLATGALVWWQASQHFRHTRSASYIERFNTAEYFAARLEVDRLISEDSSFESLIRAEVGKESDQRERDRLHVLMFANLFQEIGAAYRVSLVDRPIRGPFSDTLANITGRSSRHLSCDCGRFAVAQNCTGILSISVRRWRNWTGNTPGTRTPNSTLDFLLQTPSFVCLWISDGSKEF
ncbi:MAG: hypothetical protein SGI92_31155 [Bryobacteraceae bacterium]|nr:hypothetical protein [Bryobacteraceae bacterium]